MKAIQLRAFQRNAIDAIQGALKRDQKHIVVEIVDGCGKSLVLAKAVEILSTEQTGRILIVTDRLELKTRIKDILFNNYQDFVEIDKFNVTVETEQKILRQKNINTDEYQFVVFFDMSVSETIYETLSCREKTVIVFSSTSRGKPHKLFVPTEVVFSYSYMDAVNDGYLTPAMDTRALGPAVEAFSRQLLNYLGCEQIELPVSQQDQSWDLVVQKDTQKIWVECKAYKSQVVSPSTASSLLNGIVLDEQSRSNLLFLAFPSLYLNNSNGATKPSVPIARDTGSDAKISRPAKKHPSEHTAVITQYTVIGILLFITSWQPVVIN